MNREYIVKLCPYPARPAGIKKEDGSGQGIQIKKKDNQIEVVVGLLKDNYTDLEADYIATVGLQPLNRSDITELLCGYKEELTGVKGYLLELLNRIRRAKGLREFSYSKKLDIFAQSYASNLSFYNFNGSNHTDHYGRDLNTRLNMYLDKFKTKESISVFLNTEKLTGKELARKAIKEWLNNSLYREAIINDKYVEVGFGISKIFIKHNGEIIEKWWFIAEYSQLKEEKINRPADLGICGAKISWQYETFKYIKFGGEIETEKGNYLLIKVKTPFNCYLKQVVLNVMDKGTIGVAYIKQPKNSPITNSSLPRTINIVFKYHLNNTVLKIGDYLEAYAIFDYGRRDYDNLILLSRVMFETHNYTVATIKGATLKNPDGSYEPLKDEPPREWLNKKNLRYLVEWKGKTAYLKPASFYKFKKGDRVVILRGGYDKEIKQVELPPSAPDYNFLIETPSRAIVKNQNEIKTIEKTELVEFKESYGGDNEVDLTDKPLGFVIDGTLGEKTQLDKGFIHIKTEKEYKEDDFKQKIYSVYINKNGINIDKYSLDSLTMNSKQIDKTHWLSADGNTAELKRESMKDYLDEKYDFIAPLKFEGI